MNIRSNSFYILHISDVYEQTYACMYACYAVCMSGCVCAVKKYML